MPTEKPSDNPAGRPFLYHNIWQVDIVLEHPPVELTFRLILFVQVRLVNQSPAQYGIVLFPEKHMSLKSEKHMHRC